MNIIQLDFAIQTFSTNHVEQTILGPPRIDLLFFTRQDQWRGSLGEYHI